MKIDLRENRNDLINLKYEFLNKVLTSLGYFAIRKIGKNEARYCEGYTGSGVLEDVKFKISEGSDQN